MAAVELGVAARTRARRHHTHTRIYRGALTSEGSSRKVFMKVGILGSGDVAKTLGAGFILRGHEVMLGTRDAAKLAEWKNAQGAHAQVGTSAQAAAFGELIVLATLGVAAIDVIHQAGTANFDGKIVMDTTNPLAFDQSGPHLTVGFSDSLGEQVQRAIPKARVVKVYNTVGHAHMIDPSFAGG